MGECELIEDKTAFQKSLQKLTDELNDWYGDIMKKRKL